MKRWASLDKHYKANKVKWMFEAIFYFLYCEEDNRVADFDYRVKKDSDRRESEFAPYRKKFSVWWCWRNDPLANIPVTISNHSDGQRIKSATRNGEHHSFINLFVVAKFLPLAAALLNVFLKIGSIFGFDRFFSAVISKLINQLMPSI